MCVYIYIKLWDFDLLSFSCPGVAFGEGGRGGARYGVVGRSGGKGVGQEGNMGGAALTWGRKTAYLLYR